MLTQLKLSNFRLFDDEVTVRFRPITVFIGRNSSGKSSIVKFLLMLQQSLSGSSTEFLSPEGERVRLGPFPELKNSLTKKRDLGFKLTMKSDPKTHYSLIWRTISPDDSDRSKLQFETYATARYEMDAVAGVAGYSVVDSESGKVYVSNDTEITEGDTFLHTIDTSILSEITESDDPVQTISSNLNSLSQMMVERNTLRIFEIEINSIRHLSAVREESDRVIIAALPPLSHVGQRGQYTLPHLQNMITNQWDRYEFILPHLHNTVAIDDIDFKSSSGYVSQVLAYNATTGANVHIADYGFGVSQCLPILVQGAIMPKYTTLMVEQPEAQLHPTAQLELGSFFADLWNRRRVGSIIETHSQNILLRLRRLIANGELNCEDVSIAYFTFDQDRDNMPVVKNLDINEDGSLQSGLPMEFFGADIVEGLKLGAKV